MKLVQRTGSSQVLGYTFICYRLIGRLESCKRFKIFLFRTPPMISQSFILLLYFILFCFKQFFFFFLVTHRIHIDMNYKRAIYFTMFCIRRRSMQKQWPLLIHTRLRSLSVKLYSVYRILSGVPVWQRRVWASQRIIMVITEQQPLVPRGQTDATRLQCRKVPGGGHCPRYPVVSRVESISSQNLTYLVYNPPLARQNEYATNED